VNIVIVVFYTRKSTTEHTSMSAFGPKRTSVFALHMSAFGGKADIAKGVALTFGGQSFLSRCRFAFCSSSDCWRRPELDGAVLLNDYC
jgi:hypothetical protein